MKTKGDIEIGRRAAGVLLEREAQTGIPTSRQLTHMGLGRQLLYQWGNKGDIPGGNALSLMALEGYDVMYVLTGVRTT